MKSDIIVIGGGASGLVAALGAADVTVLEKMPKAGRKVMITGKGRCNFTNVKEWGDFADHVRTDTNFVSPAWHNLTPEKLIELFKANGLRSVVERGDRAFPESHMAGDVVDTLLRACTLAGVKVVTGCEVKTVDKTARGWSLDTVKTITKERRIPSDDPRKKPQFKIETKIETEEYTCSKLIIATGGLSYPGTGSTGDGYMWAEELGHSVEPCYPSLTALGGRDQAGLPRPYRLRKDEGAQDYSPARVVSQVREAYRTHQAPLRGGRTFQRKQPGECPAHPLHQRRRGPERVRRHRVHRRRPGRPARLHGEPEGGQRPQQRPESECLHRPQARRGAGETR